jgi:hypothetical protein
MIKPIMDEYIGKNHRLAFYTVVIIADHPNKITWQMKKAGLRLPAFVTLELCDSPDGIRLKHELRIGYKGFGKLLDPLIRLYFNKSFQNALDEHCQIEWYKLAQYLSPQKYEGGGALRVKVIAQHPGEGAFPTFAKGTMVTMDEECTHFLHWHPCVIEGHETYVPECFVTSGKLICDYNPTELVAEVGDILEVQEIVYAWLIATNENGAKGWIPVESVISVNIKER